MACWCFGAPKALDEDGADDYGNVAQAMAGSSNRKGASSASPRGAGGHDKGAAADDRMAMSSLAVLHAAQIRNIRSDNAGTGPPGLMGKGGFSSDLAGQRLPEGGLGRSGWHAGDGHSRGGGYDGQGDPRGSDMGTSGAFAQGKKYGESSGAGDTPSHSLMGVSFERTSYLDAAPGRPRILAWMEDADMAFAVVNEASNEAVPVADSPLQRTAGTEGDSGLPIVAAPVRVPLELLFRSSLRDGSYLDLCATTAAAPPPASRAHGPPPSSLASITQQRRAARRDYSPARAAGAGGALHQLPPSGAWKAGGEGQAAGESVDAASKISQQGSAWEARGGSRLGMERKAEAGAEGGKEAGAAGKSRGEVPSDAEESVGKGGAQRRLSNDAGAGEAASASAIPLGSVSGGAGGSKAVDESSVQAAGGRAVEGSFPPSPMRDRSWYAVSPTPGSPALGLAQMVRSASGAEKGEGKAERAGGQMGGSSRDAVPGKKEEPNGEAGAAGGAGDAGSSHGRPGDVSSTESSG